MPVFEPALRRDGRGSVAGRRGWRALLLLLLLAQRLPDLGFLFFLPVVDRALPKLMLRGCWRSAPPRLPAKLLLPPWLLRRDMLPGVRAPADDAMAEPGRRAEVDLGAKGGMGVRKGGRGERTVIVSKRESKSVNKQSTGDGDNITAAYRPTLPPQLYHSSYSPLVEGIVALAPALEQLLRRGLLVEAADVEEELLAQLPVVLLEALGDSLLVVLEQDLQRERGTHRAKGRKGREK